MPNAVVAREMPIVSYIGCLETDRWCGVVIVQGRVSTYYLRQVAVECIKHVPGVSRLEDHMEVAVEVASYRPCDVQRKPGGCTSLAHERAEQVQ